MSAREEQYADEMVEAWLEDRAIEAAERAEFEPDEPPGLPLSDAEEVAVDFAAWDDDEEPF